MTQKTRRVIVCPIFNFELEGENEREFQISNQILLRRIKPDELARMKKPPYTFLLPETYAHLNKQTYVFEIDHDDFREADLLVYETLLAIRLFKKGPIFCKDFWLEEDSMVGQFFTINPPIPWSLTKYSLDANEINEIKKLLEKIINIELIKNRSFRVACERFSRSFEERRDDDKVIDLAIAFEALFTDEKTSKTNVMGELVGLGCSMLIGTNQKEREEIKQFLKKSFKVRNDIVHGSEVKTPIIINKQEYKISDISSQLQEYLGASIRKLI